MSFIERISEECHGLRGDLQRQETLVVQRDGAIASLRDEACTQWASGWLAFKRRVANDYPGLDLNFDNPSDKEAKSHFPPTVLESLPPRLRPVPLLHFLLPLMCMTSKLLCIILFVFFSTLGFEPWIYVMSFSINTPFSISSLFSCFSFFFFYNCFFDAAFTFADLDRWLYGLCLSS